MNAEEKLRQQMAENDDLATQLNQMTLELDSLHTQHQGVLTNIDLFKQKNEDDNELLIRYQEAVEEVKGSVNSCITEINLFAQHFDHMSKQPSLIRTNVSKRFRDLMLLYINLQPVQDLPSLQDAAKKIEQCLKASLDEVETNVKSLVNIKGDLQFQSQKLSSTQRNFEGLEQDQELLREKEKYLKSEVENARDQQRQLEKEREIWYKR